MLLTYVACVSLLAVGWVSAEAAEEAEPTKEDVQRAAVEKQREILEAIHQAEIQRLQARKKIGQERDRDDLVQEADEMIAEAEARHAAALARLEPGGPSEEKE